MRDIQGPLIRLPLLAHRLGRGLLLLALLALLAGCDIGAAPPTAVPTRTPPPAAQGCQYRFDATVRSGPSAGTYIQGTLILVPTDTTQHNLRGYVVPPGAEKAPDKFVPVSAQVQDKAVDLTFTLTGGNTIHGTGTLETSFAECSGTMGGTFSGPVSPDTGDWLAGANRVNICSQEIGQAFQVDMCTNFIACCK